MHACIGGSGQGRSLNLEHPSVTCLWMTQHQPLRWCCHVSLPPSRGIAAVAAARCAPVRPNLAGHSRRRCQLQHLLYVGELVARLAQCCAPPHFLSIHTLPALKTDHLLVVGKERGNNLATHV